MKISCGNVEVKDIPYYHGPNEVERIQLRKAGTKRWATFPRKEITNLIIALNVFKEPKQ